MYIPIRAVWRTKPQPKEATETHAKTKSAL